MNKACKTYYKNLKLFLPIHKATEKQLFQDIKSALNNLSEENPAINYSEIIYVFLTIFLYLLKCPQSLIL